MGKNNLDHFSRPSRPHKTWKTFFYVFIYASIFCLYVKFIYSGFFHKNPLSSLLSRMSQDKQIKNIFEKLIAIRIENVDIKKNQYKR